MTTDHATPAPEAVRSASVEKAFAVAEVAAPVVTAAAMPLLQADAATTMCTFLAAPVLVAGLNYAGLIADQTLDAVPGGDIVRAHRRPMFVSAVATVTAAATATVSGLPGIDALAAGWMEMPSVSGLVSVAWWGSVAFVGFSLRRVLSGSRRPRRKAAPAQQSAAPDQLPHEVRKVLELWKAHICGEYGAHTGEDLHLTQLGPGAWEGIVQAQPGRPVTVTAETVSGVYRIPAAWVSIKEGPHTSSKYIHVDLVAPPADQVQRGELEDRWLRRVARKGGCVPGTHLEGLIDDPATGGVAAWVVADEDTDTVPVPDIHQLAGALHTTPLLVSFEPTQDPRRAKFRKMERSPLEDGRPLPGPQALRANENGFVQLGTGISGRPGRIQLFDLKGGARHVLVAGVTGSGKGGVLQLVCLSYHVNKVAIIYADPKGSSNPDVEDMASYAGCGREKAMGALRLAYAILQYRVAQSQRMRMKNFVPTDEMPFIALVLDEFAQLLGENSPFLAEAAMIVAAVAETGRSLGMCVVLCGQILNLDKMGGDTSIRDNIFYGGALILLRSDSAQKHRVDLPDSFDGVDPSKIPAYWQSSDQDSLIYDPTVPENDPRRTFGVGYVVGPDERAEMMRAWILESAAGLFDPANIAVPHDFPGWDDRDLIAATPVDPTARPGTGTDGEDGGTAWEPGPAPTVLTKEPTAKEKILRTLDDYRDPMNEEIVFLSLDAIVDITGVLKKTAENTCSKLVGNKTLVRRGAGEYGLPLLKNTGQGSLPEPADSL
ncbi:type IV secretory system conjugative DNA transfer family protein [Kitasatospora aureofaciens]|uniref:type IV secretory system conjugative DNA transfer family protein n=1 Tax=Kitasatospora aureofaciens TaxID=1894 RepID=UPI0033F637EA